jgi:hypothetical protein
MARTPDRKREALWRGRVNRQLLSGLSISQFCSQEQCAVSAFYRWKRHFDLPAHPDKCSALPAPRSTFQPRTSALPVGSSALLREPGLAPEAQNDQPIS